MYARVINSSIVREKVDAGLSVWRDTLVPAMKHEKGFRGVCLVSNRKTGQCMAITLWETEADANAMEDLQAQTLALFNGLFTCSPEHQYEVILQV